MSEKELILYGINADPPHLGHLRVVEVLLKRFKDAEVIVMPTGDHPFSKPQKGSNHDRFVMTELLFKGLERTTVDDFEIASKSKSYTVHTLEHLKAKYPDINLFFALSSDAANHFFSWHEPEKILKLATPIVIARPHVGLDPKVVDQLKKLSHPIFLEDEMLDISSTQIRSAFKEGKIPTEIELGVLDYIISHKLYR
jgi:nicotinate-nucleotide adenylyltransferase